MKKGLIIFSDGTMIEGVSVGAEGTAIGGLIHYNGLTDYANAICDPAFQDQVVCMTYPLIGQVGVLQDKLNVRPAAAGLLIRETIDQADHWRSEITLAQWLRQQNIVAVGGVDTRAVMLKLRRQGALRAVLTTETDADIAGLATMAQQWKPAAVIPSVKQKKELPDRGPAQYHIAVLDLGVAESTLDALSRRGCRLSLWPETSGSAAIIAEKPDALLLSSGPEDAVYAQRERFRPLLDQLSGKIPVWGIGAGHLLIADYLGWVIAEMSPGHHGVNYPVLDLAGGRTYMTTQHHHLSVLASPSADRRGEPTHININDQTVEGLQTPAFRCVQFMPDSGSGSHQTGHLWDLWLKDLH